jgi:hypothetical protein
MKEHELACSFKVGKPRHDSLRERTSSLDFPDQSPLQSSANLQRRTPVIPFQPPTSLLNNFPFGNLPSFAASNHLNQIMMYQNLFPQQLAARFRSLAENSIQNKREKVIFVHFPWQLMIISVTNSTFISACVSYIVCKI